MLHLERKRKDLVRKNEENKTKINTTTHYIDRHHEMRGKSGKKKEEDEELQEGWRGVYVHAVNTVQQRAKQVLLPTN